ncbi:MarR family transcriptional regulator [Porticoccus sp. W117]|uniref:MarR family winged helix-turn-helix transcriptional regulator n=1 Tax=Porticoccus sp. W117 TaxID=3054777 RepID=UPI002596770B|nr:MarR family transcriptional regulator [Porticoccus sp. W117]MDM3870485.1 MarR family transcriptional regulator [Porticoccus sp. W117]
MPSNFADTHSKNALRAWLQLTKCAKGIEGRVNSCFVNDHNSSLSRFDVLANLDRMPEGRASTSQLAKMLLASKGNITRLLDRMEGDGLIERKPSEVDRRVSDIHLADKGKQLFAAMAADHERWADDIFGALSNDEIKTLIELIGKLRGRLDEA